MEWLAKIEERSRIGEVPPGDAPWVPPILANVPPETLRKLRYVVLDELDHVEGDVVLVASEWPTVDALGRVRHPPEAVREQYVEVPKWVALVGRRRVPEEVRTRAPRVGDTFAMRLGRSDDVTRPKGPVVDITADAREAARAAFYGAVANPIDAAVAGAIRTPEDAPHIVVEMPEEWR